MATELQAHERASAGRGVDPSARAEEIGRRLVVFAGEHGLPGDRPAQVLLSLLTTLAAVPKGVFSEFPEYRVAGIGAAELTIPTELTRSPHEFFDVVRARGSRRDFGPAPLDQSRLLGLLGWTFGVRGRALAYDYRDTPVRYIPSAGGLGSADAYVVVNRVDGLASGSYYFDNEAGLVPLVRGVMLPSLAATLPDQHWVAESAVLVVVVANLARIESKYGPMAPKLAALDAGVALGHLELVATALELRAAILGGLPADVLRGVLRLDDPDRLPIASVAVGTRPGGNHAH